MVNNRLTRKERLELAASRAKAAGIPAPTITPTPKGGGIIEPFASEKEKKLKNIVEAKEILAARGEPTPEEVPVVSEPLVPEVQPEQELDPVTGEPLLSGGVSSAQPLIEDTALFFAGGGGIVPKGFKLATVGKGLTLPISAKAVSVAAGKKKVTTGLLAKTAGLREAASKIGFKTLAGLYGISKIVGQPVARLQSIDTALGQIRETITAPVAGVRNGAFSASEGLDMMDDLEAAINEYERSLNSLERKVFFTTFNREKMDSAKIRIRKLKRFIDVGRQDIALVAVSEIAPDSELIALMLEDLKGGGK